MMKIDGEIARYASRIFLLVLIPFLIGYWVVPHSETVKGDLVTNPVESVPGGSDTITYSFSHNYDIATENKIGSVFPFANYLDFPPFVSHTNLRICFQDNGSYLTYPNGTTFEPDFSWNVNFNKRINLSVDDESENCTGAAFDEKFNYDLKAYIPLSSVGNCTYQGIPCTYDQISFTPRIVAYPKWDVQYGLLQGLVLIPAIYLFIWYPIAGIVKKVRHGMMEN